MSIEKHDARAIYCRQLGCVIPFRYCRTMNQKQPCRSIADCWHEYIDIVSFLEEHYTPDQISEIADPMRPDKIARLVELAEKARRAKS